MYIYVIYIYILCYIYIYMSLILYFIQSIVFGGGVLFTDKSGFWNHYPKKSLVFCRSLSKLAMLTFIVLLTVRFKVFLP